MRRFFIFLRSPGHLLVIAFFIGLSHAAELWCMQNYYKMESDKLISDFMCRTDTNETIFQQCDAYNPPFSNCSHQPIKNLLNRKGHLPYKGPYLVFDDIEFFHIKFTDLGPWNERQCYGSDGNFFRLNQKMREFAMNYIIYKHNTTEFWLPAFSENYNPALWRIPGKMWREPVKKDYDKLSSVDCVSVNITAGLGPVIVMRNCIDNLSMLCVSSETPIMQGRCRPGSVALRTIPDQCYRLIPGELRTPVVNPNFTAMHLSIATKYLIRYSGQPGINRCLVHYDRALNKSIVMNSYGGIDIMIGIPRSLNCQIEQYTIPRAGETEIFLSFEPSVESLFLTVYNHRSIWCDSDSSSHSRECGIKCFTNADYKLINTVQIEKLLWGDSKKAIFELAIHGDGPGYYWCEAHSIHNFELISSPKIVASKKQKGHPFSFFFILPCSLVPCNRINTNMQQYGKFVEILLNQLKDHRGTTHNFKDLNCHSVHVMAIESVVPKDHLIVLCHARVALKGSSVDNSSEKDDLEYIEELNGKPDHDIHIRRHMKKLSKILATYTRINAVNSTKYCFPETSTFLNRTWQPAQLGESTTTYALCLLGDGVSLSRKCIGDFLYGHGAAWEPIDSFQTCASRISNEVTKVLYYIDHTKYAENQTAKALHMVEAVMNSTVKIIPADLFYLGRIMQSVAKVMKSSVDRQTSNTTETIPQIHTNDNIERIIRIFNNIMNVERSVLQRAGKLNSTNTLLDAFENIFSTISLRNGTSFSNGTNSSVHPEKGVTVYRSPRFVAFIIDPTISNYSGVALFSDADSKDFRDSRIRFLTSNESQLDLLTEDQLEIGTFVPQTLLNRLNEIPSQINETLRERRPLLRIVINVYYNDKLFQENCDIVENLVFSKIISVTIPGYNPALPEHLPLFFRPYKNKDNETIDSCRYWNFSTWANDGLEFINKSDSGNYVVHCGSSHLTPFAYLVGGFYNLSVTADLVNILKNHKEALDIITLLGCSLSLLGITGIVLTAIIFGKWREKPTSKVILNFSFAIALQMILFCFVNTEFLTMHLLKNKIFSSCIILGACLHYSVLVQFSWMLIIAYLQYKRYVQVFGNTRPPRFFLKAFILGWCVPMIPVAAVIITNMESYIPIANFDASEICYPTGHALFFGVILPITAIIVANLIIYVLVLYNLVRGPKENIPSMDWSLALSQIRLSILLFFLLGFTWIFGLLAAVKISLVFSYLFCFTGTLQGLVMFIYFIILDPVARGMWVTFIKGLISDLKSK